MNVWGKLTNGADCMKAYRQWLNCPATDLWGIPKFETTRLVSKRFKNR